MALYTKLKEFLLINKIKSKLFKDKYIIPKIDKNTWLINNSKI